jgi:hypothetical protein
MDQSILEHASVAVAVRQVSECVVQRSKVANTATSRSHRINAEVLLKAADTASGLCHVQKARLTAL